MTAPRRLLLIFGFVLSTLLMAVHPAPTAAAPDYPTTTYTPQALWCESLGIKIPLLWWSPLGIVTVPIQNQPWIEQHGAICTAYWHDYATVHIQSANTELTISTEAMTYAPTRYLITTGVFVRWTFPPNSNLLDFRIQVMMVAPAIDITQGFNYTSDGGVFFPKTGHSVPQYLYQYWQANGGLDTYGYPITQQITQILEDGRLHDVQYFEKGRLEYHPDNAEPYKIQLGQFGRMVGELRLVSFQGTPRAKDHTCSYDTETSHNLCGSFGDYWRANGGLAQFGRPLTEEFSEKLEDGKTYTVQYFERARFEHHPENADPKYKILLGHFGRAIANSWTVLRQSSYPKN